MLTAVVGINWGDEGKGRMVDLLSKASDIVVRYQGGNNAGHTVVNERGKFVLNLLPSGILRENTVNVMGGGMVVDLAHLNGEIENLRENGIAISPDNLKISDQATVLMPYHVQLDILEEERLKDAKFGSTRRGIAPAYADKYYKKTLRMMDLFSPTNVLKEKVEAFVEWKNLTIENGYGESPVSAQEVMAWLAAYGEPIKPFICNTTYYLQHAIDEGKEVMLEAQLGALRDIDFGIYPYTTSSSTISAFAPIGAGIPNRRIDAVLGSMKAYSSCVGEGPFTAELFGEEADKLRTAGNEFGAATGRPRRVGAFDVVASKYGVMVQGATALCLTLLDVLSYMEKIPVCVAYEIDGEITHEFPTGERLLRAKPVVEYLDGFGMDVSGCRTMEALPPSAVAYVKYIEKAVGCPIQYISVGPERDAYIQVF